MFTNRPNDYTFEIVTSIIILFALIGLGTLGYLLFSWIF